jgi:hypothetical protein
VIAKFSVEDLETPDNLPMTLSGPGRRCWLRFESGDGKNVASVNLDNPLFRFQRKVSRRILLRNVPFHRVWEPTGFRSKSDFDPITDRQQFQRICQRFEYRHSSSEKGVLESQYWLTPPAPPILTQDSGADTLCLDIDFLTIRIPRQTSGIGRLHEGLDEIVGYASRYRHSSVRLRGS